MSSFDKNYFQLFGLAVSFDINPGQVAERYRELQRLVHPDRFATGTEQEKRMAVQLAARINDAYQSLKDPLERAKYMLQLAGFNIADDQGNSVDPAFLLDQMEKREHLAQLQGSPDPGPGLMRLDQEVDSELQDLVQGISSAFRENAEDSNQRVHMLVKKLQFVRKLRDEITALEERLL